MRLRRALTVLFAVALSLSAPAGCALSPSPDVPASAAPSGPLPGDSLYQLPLRLVDSAGVEHPLGVHRGHPTLVSMFYASCPAACPMLIHDLQAIEARLAPTERDDLRVLLVSFDPDRDTPEALSALAVERHVDLQRWALASTPEADVRTLAATLGISYRRLENGHYNHSAVITLLDRDGVPRGRIEGLSQAPEALVEAIGALHR